MGLAGSRSIRTIRLLPITMQQHGIAPLTEWRCPPLPSGDCNDLLLLLLANAGNDYGSDNNATITACGVYLRWNDGTWSQVAEPNTALIRMSNNAKPCRFGAEHYTFKWTIANSVCPATSATVNIVNYAISKTWIPIRSKYVKDNLRIVKWWCAYRRQWV